MKVLTQESLRDAIKQCQEIERYRVLIVVDNIQLDVNALNYFKSSELLNYCISRNNTYFRFHNGSVIRYINASSNARGHKANLVLCEQHMFEDDDIRAILMAFEIGNINFNLMQEV